MRARRRLLWLVLGAMLPAASANGDVDDAPTSASASSSATSAASTSAPSLEGQPAQKLEASGRAIADAITELDVERARKLFEELPQASGLGFQRARLAVYAGDCDSAEATLSTLPESPETQNLRMLALNCARATAGSVVVDRPDAGVWMRFQDAGDQVLVPLIVDVAIRSRKTMIEDLGVDLPRPLRIEIVRDLFTLSAMTGLPLQAAETTGTVAVARWGRVTMISPRAARHGYPWQDTLAHEVTHLALTRGSRDFAPLWLQEGIAKREEVRWRETRPFDDKRNPHRIARDALLDGNSVGIDRIGPSIAMLPSPQAASISYAEVESFMDFWIGQVGRAAFALLLADMKGLESRDPDAALISVSGYPLAYWIARWQESLLALPEAPLEPEAELAEARLPGVQSVRLGDLLQERAGAALAAPYFDDAMVSSPDKAAVRWRAAAARVALGEPAAAGERLGSIDDVSSLYGSWLGLHGRILLEVQKATDAERAFGLALAVDPIGEDAACEGHSPRSTPPAPSSAGVTEVPAATTGTAPPQLQVPNEPTRRALCAEARRAARD